MPDIAAAAEAVVARLTAAGIRATTELADLNPPAVIVRAPVVAYRFKGGTWAAEWTAHAVSPDPGYGASMKILGPLLDAVQSALGGDPVEARPVLIIAADGAELPGYELTWSERITV